VWRAVVLKVVSLCNEPFRVAVALLIKMILFWIIFFFILYFKHTSINTYIFLAFTRIESRINCFFDFFILQPKIMNRCRYFACRERKHDWVVLHPHIIYCCMLTKVVSKNNVKAMMAERDGVKRLFTKFSLIVYTHK